MAIIVNVSITTSNIISLTVCSIFDLPPLGFMMAHCTAASLGRRYVSNQV